MRLRFWFLVIAVAVGCAALTIWEINGSGAGHDHDDERPPAVPNRVAKVGDEVAVVLDVAAQRANGIETAKLAAGEHRRELRAFGAILDLRQLTDLGNGYVAALSARQTAQARLAASRPAYERAASLYKVQGASEAQAQAAEATFRIDEAGVAAAESQLRTLAATARQEWGATLTTALIGRSPLFVRLLQQQDVLLQVTLAPGVTVAGRPESAFVQHADGSRTALHFVSLATKTDRQIQGISFFYTAPAEPRFLPGMSVLAFVPSGASIEGVVVPPDAVVWWHGSAWVYLRTGSDHFVRRAIATDIPTSQSGYVVPKLGDGSEVVTRGAQMLLSEEQRQGLAGDE